MSNLDLTINQDDLKALYVHTRFAYGNLTFDQWAKEIKKAYIDFAKNQDNPKTYSQWVNGQILALAY